MENQYKKYYKRKLQKELNEVALGELIGRAGRAAGRAVRKGVEAVRNRPRGTIRSHVLAAALLTPVAGPGTKTMIHPGAPAIQGTSDTTTMIHPGTPSKTIETQGRKEVKIPDPNAQLHITTQIAGPKTPPEGTITGRDLKGNPIRVKLDSKGQLPTGTESVVLGGEHANLALGRSAPGSVTRKQAQAVLDNPVVRDVGGDITRDVVPGTPPTFRTTPGTPGLPAIPPTFGTTPGSMIPQHIEANLEEPPTIQQAPPRRRRRGEVTFTNSGSGQSSDGNSKVLRTGRTGDDSRPRPTPIPIPIPPPTPKPSTVRVPVVTPGRVGKGVGDPKRTVLVPKNSGPGRRGRLTNIRENNRSQSLNEAIENIRNKK